MPVIVVISTFLKLFLYFLLSQCHESDLPTGVSAGK